MPIRHFGGQQLRQAREAAALSREHLARTVGISVYTCTDYERGTARPSADVLAALADALGVAVDDLYTAVEDHHDAA